VGLKQDAVDLFEVGGFGAVADSFEEAGQGDVPGAADEALGGSDDEIERLGGECLVGEADLVELAEDEVADLIGIEFGQEDRVGDAAFDVVVDGEVDFGQEGGLADENQIVIFGEVFEQKAEFAKAVDVHEVGVVDDGSDHFVEVVETEGFLDEAFFASEVAAVEIDLESLAEDAQGVEVGVKCAVDDGNDEAFGVMVLKGVFDDGFAASGFAQQEAKAALLAVDFEGVEGFLLMSQEGDVFWGEGVLVDAEVGADHGVIPFRRF